MSLLLSQLSPVVPPSVTVFDGWWTPVLLEAQVLLSHNSGWYTPLAVDDQIIISKGDGWSF